MDLSTSTVLFAGIIAVLISIPEPPPSPHRPVRIDRVVVKQPAQTCAQQTWPNISPACLHFRNQGQSVRDVRVVNGKS